jgi:hypothetical protein
MKRATDGKNLFTDGTGAMLLKSAASGARSPASEVSIVELTGCFDGVFAGTPKMKLQSIRCGQ